MNLFQCGNGHGPEVRVEHSSENEWSKRSQRNFEQDMQLGLSYCLELKKKLDELHPEAAILLQRLVSF